MSPDHKSASAFCHANVQWYEHYEPECGNALRAYLDLAAQLEEAQAACLESSTMLAKVADDLEAARKDAERYRWLRDLHAMHKAEITFHRVSDDIEIIPGKLSAAIDAAMRDQQSVSEG